MSRLVVDLVLLSKYPIDRASRPPLVSRWIQPSSMTTRRRGRRTRSVRRLCLRTRVCVLDRAGLYVAVDSVG